MKEKVLECGICGVSSEKKIIKYCGKTQCNLCSKHYAQIYRYGKITDATPATIQDKNQYVLHDEYAEMILVDGRNNYVATAVIDLEDVEKCKPYKWAFVNRYVISRIHGKNVRLHRFLLDYYGDKVIDHIDRNPLNNRRSNMRIVEITINNCNREAKNIRCSDNGKYSVELRRFGKRYTSRRFDTMEEALEEKNKIIKKFENEIDSHIKEYQLKKGITMTGVSLVPSGRWKANFWRNNKCHYVGTYDTKEEAYEARMKALRIYNQKKQAG